MSVLTDPALAALMERAGVDAAEDYIWYCTRHLSASNRQHAQRHDTHGKDNGANWKL